MIQKINFTNCKNNNLLNKKVICLSKKNLLTKTFQFKLHPQMHSSGIQPLQYSVVNLLQNIKLGTSKNQIINKSKTIQVEHKINHHHLKSDSSTSNITDYNKLLKIEREKFESIESLRFSNNNYLNNNNINNNNNSNNNNNHNNSTNNSKDKKQLFSNGLIKKAISSVNVKQNDTISDYKKFTSLNPNLPKLYSQKITFSFDGRKTDKPFGNENELKKKIENKFIFNELTRNTHNLDESGDGIYPINLKGKYSTEEAYPDKFKDISDVKSKVKKDNSCQTDEMSLKDFLIHSHKKSINKINLDSKEINKNRPTTKSKEKKRKDIKMKYQQIIKKVIDLKIDKKPLDKHKGISHKFFNKTKSMKTPYTSHKKRSCASFNTNGENKTNNKKAHNNTFNNNSNINNNNNNISNNKENNVNESENKLRSISSSNCSKKKFDIGPTKLIFKFNNIELKKPNDSTSGSSFALLPNCPKSTITIYGGHYFSVKKFNELFIRSNKNLS